MITIYIDNKKFQFNEICTILNACQEIGIFIPKFCFDQDLKISGNCRMCLVEVVGFINPVASCTFKIFNNIRIFTNSSLAKKSRENVMEFLLINHPLDCPICDQGGECDLQDLSLIHGIDKSRFYEKKKTVEDLGYNSIIKTVMTRCILCTKCVRFMESINKNNNLGVIGRGKNMEIGFYTKSSFISNFSANIVDLCPVGALTLQPSSFVSRDWFVKKYYNSFEILDNQCSFVTIYVYNNNIIKITPNYRFNVKYLSNSSRFFFRSVYFNRIQNPLKKDLFNFNNVSINYVCTVFKQLLDLKDISNFNFIFGNSITLNNILVISNFLKNLGLKNINLEDLKISNINSDLTSNFLTNKFSFDNFELLLLIGCNFDNENENLNINLIKQKDKIFNIGSSNSKYGFTDLGLSLKTFINILEGKHRFCKTLKLTKKPIIMLGKDFLKYKYSYILVDYLKKNTKFKIINLFSNCSSINFVEIFGKFNQKKIINSCKVLYLYNTKNFLKEKKNYFVIYQGHHFTKDALQSDLIIPGNTFFEERALSLDMYGNIKKSTSPVINFYNKYNLKTDNIFFSYLKTFIFKNSKNYSYKNLSYLLDYYIYIFTYDKTILLPKKFLYNLRYKIIFKNKNLIQKSILEYFSK